MTLTIQIVDVLLTLAVVIIVTRTFQSEDRVNRAHGRGSGEKLSEVSLRLRHTSIGITITESCFIGSGPHREMRDTEHRAAAPPRAHRRDPHRSRLDDA